MCLICIVGFCTQCVAPNELGFQIVKFLSKVIQTFRIRLEIIFRGKCRIYENACTFKVKEVDVSEMSSLSE